jgi:hypothetical protein
MSPPSFDLSVSEMMIFSHVSFLDRQSKSFHDLAYREFEGLENLLPLNFPSAKC